MKLTRREVLATPVLAVPAASAPAASRPPGVWIDPKLAALPARPWRKIHLDFHNTAHMPAIGTRFNADEFGDQLVHAQVDSIVVFAKDMHGYFYYPSQYGPVHPGLKFDLLGAQVEACRKRKIAVYAYYCVTWDHYLAERHPEWLVLKRDRTSYLPKFDETPGWTALCIAHNAFVELVEAHTREFVGRYALNGAWFDMPFPIGGECFCRVCLDELRRRGLDPLDKSVQRRHKQELEVNLLRRLHRTVVKTRPGCQVDFNNQAALGLGERAPHMDNIDLEALPSAAAWGYYFFPLVTRYARTFGLTTYGMTGRFHASWADFGGLKQPAQLETEVAGIVANAARCDIGDQMPPGGRLDPAVYHVIGKAYAHIRAIEPYLEGAVPVAEAALMVSGLPLERLNTDTNVGLVKLLTELRVQFDVVETGAGWERYALMVLGEGLEVTPELAARLEKYVAAGGALLVSDTAGLEAGSRQGWLGRFGLDYAGASPYKPAYLVPREKFTGDIPDYEYALYEGASQWRARAPARVIAALGEPLFQRSPARYTSHRQTPFERATEFAALAQCGPVALAAFPLGLSYFNHGYWIYRAAAAHLLKGVLPQQLVTTNAPVSAEVEVTHQARKGTRPERYLVHVVNWSANRATARHPVFYEEPVPLTNIRVGLRLPLNCRTARAVVANRDLPVRSSGGAVEATIERVPVHEIVVFEVA